MEQGTGKTIVSLAAINKLLPKGGIIIVATPKAVIYGWKKEIKKHLKRRYRIITSKEDLWRVKRDKKLNFIILNYEQIKLLLPVLKKVKADFIILDESHRVKSRKTGNFKAVYQLGKKTLYKLILTGTPIGNDMIDLWAQYKFLNPSIWGGVWKHFEKLYCRVKRFDNHVKKERIKVNAKKKLTKLASPFTYRVKADEELELPPVIEIVKEVELSPSVRTHYNEMFENFLTEFGELKASTDLTVTNMLRLQQLAGGHLVLDNDEGVVRLYQDKLFMLIETIKDLPEDEKVVIFVRFTTELEVIVEALKKISRVPNVIRGGMTAKALGNSWLSFQNNPKVKAIVVQIQSGGVGIELYGARYCFYYSKSFSFIDYEQSKKRIHRIGQKRKTFIYHLNSKNTIDTYLQTMLRYKYKMSEDVLLHLMLKHNKGE